MSETLKRCPNICCKSDPRMLHNKARAGYLVLCRACGWNASKLKERKEDAIAAWNSRPNDAVIEAAQKVADANWIFIHTPMALTAFTEANKAFWESIRALAKLLPPKEGNNV